MIRKTHKVQVPKSNAEDTWVAKVLFLLGFLSRPVLNPVFLRLTNLEIHADRLIALLICWQIVSLGNLESFTVRILGDFPSFLSALASNNAFIAERISCRAH